jgi:hypothetical protein
MKWHSGMGSVVATAEELRAQAKQLYALAAKAQIGEERLTYVLQAIALEAEADAMERRLRDEGESTDS